jgi:hypothetical protein
VRIESIYHEGKSLSVMAILQTLKRSFLLTTTSTGKGSIGRRRFMPGSGCLIIKQTKDWTNLSKVVIRTDNRDLLHCLLLKTTEMSGNGFGKIIYNFGYKDDELRIFSRFGSGRDVLSHLLDGQDYNRLSTEATIETIN